MPLPPEFLKLKRKRNEEAIDLLYIQIDSRDPKRSFTETNFQFQRIGPEIVLDQQQKFRRLSDSNHRSSNGPQVPTVRSTLPGEEDSRTTPTSFKELGTALQPRSSRTPALFQDAATCNQTLPQARNVQYMPRKFHLSKDSITYSRQYRNANNRIQKRSKTRHSELAVFTERTTELLAAMVSQDVSSAEEKYPFNLPQPSVEPQVDNEVKRKRPNATEAERKWRSSNWKKRPQPEATAEPERTGSSKEDTASIQRDHDTLQLARELQKFALEQTTSYEASSPSNPPRNTPPAPSPHHSPPSPAPHSPNPPPPDEYILETYIRKPNPNPHSSSNPNPTHPSYGLLVIPDSDLPDWEAYLTDESDAEEGYSDDEDENAEDFYANDYPEEEVRSDDEFGRGAYGYRQGASDEEEFGEGTWGWGGEEEGEEEEEEERGWRREVGMGAR